MLLISGAGLILCEGIFLNEQVRIPDPVCIRPRESARGMARGGVGGNELVPFNPGSQRDEGVR